MDKIKSAARNQYE